MSAVNLELTETIRARGLTHERRPMNYTGGNA